MTCCHTPGPWSLAAAGGGGTGAMAPPLAREGGAILSVAAER